MENLESKGYKNNTKEYWLLPENLKKIEKWAQEGLIIEQLAKNMGIGKSTLYNYRQECPEIDNAWLQGKMAADLQIVNAMFKSASGYKAEEKVYIRDEAGNMVLDKIIEKEIPGNVSAQSMWIKNRMPGFMKDNQLTETYRKKVEAETEKIKADTLLAEAKIALLKGESKDSGHLNALVSLLDELKERE